ncbi:MULTISPECIES: coniferyl-alcohol dehydrogenase [unclassified Nocardioides]|uniref:coniferyl-alcohol dehydrogenase n=1 Tax=unclassified Nocardioides TaxID=2615069 RepID=UPI003617ABB9
MTALRARYASYVGQRVLVTGGASGIGRATARALVEQGARVTGADVVPADDDGVEGVLVDLSDRSALAAFVEADDGPYDAVFNCAGLSTGAAEPVQVMKVNFLGLRYLSERLVRERMRPGGAVVSVASIAAMGWERHVETLTALLACGEFESAEHWCRAHPDLLTQGGYRLAKRAVVYWTMRFAAEAAGHGVRVNSASPGVTDTPMLAVASASLGAGRVFDHETPMDRMAAPEEQADVLLFLNSSAASYVTGTNVWVDGGYAGAFASGVGSA